MMKDPTEFRERFLRWKNGELVYEYGLPKYEDGRSPYDDSTDFITRYEGFSDTTYQKKGDKPTIGYGTTRKKWVDLKRITEQLGRMAMMEDLDANEPLLKKYIKNYDRFPDSAKTVLRDILYNVGQGNMFLKSPKFMEALNAGNWEEAANLMDWDNNKSGFAGARKRNKARRELFLRDLTNNPVEPRSLFVESLYNSPAGYKSRFKYIKPAQTDYSITNRAGGKLNAWNGAESPSYGGYNVRIPSVRQIVERSMPKNIWIK